MDKIDKDKFDEAMEYVRRDKLLSEDNIRNIICQDILADIPEACKPCSRKDICRDIISKLSSKIAKTELENK